MKKNIQKLAMERIELLIKYAIFNVKSDTTLAKQYIIRARNICMKYRIKIPYEITIFFCKKCKCFIAPCIDSKIRIGGSQIKSVRITCNLCGHIYHKIIVPK